MRGFRLVGVRLVQVVLHVGAHRTGSTSLQRALAANRPLMARQGVAYWGPGMLRDGLFSGLLRDPLRGDPETLRLCRRNCGLVGVELSRLAERGRRMLLISEENMLGTMGANLLTGTLYPAASMRLGRIAQALGGRVCRVVLAVRPQADYWASVLAFRVRNGAPLPDRALLEGLVVQPRGWRHVAADLARHFPEAEIALWDFDRLKGRVNAQYRILTGGHGWIREDGARHNASPGLAELRQLLTERGDRAAARRLPRGRGRWMPFDADQRRRLDAAWRADLDWLRGVGRRPAEGEGRRLRA